MRQWIVGFVGIVLLGGLTGCVGYSKMVVSVKGIQDNVEYGVEYDVFSHPN